MVINPFEHGVSQGGVTDELIAVVAVFIMLVQVDVINAGTAVKQHVINNETFKVQYAQRFTRIHRDAVHRNHAVGMLLGHLTIPVGVSDAARGTNAPALGAVPVN